MVGESPAFLTSGPPIALAIGGPLSFDRGMRFWIRHLTACLLLVGCGAGGGGTSPELTLVGARPTPGGAPLLLNDDIRLKFSALIDATSVTADSVRIVDEATGDSARGSWHVDGRSLRFQPEGVLSRSLLDGGYQPGATYRVEIRGFPYIGGVRSMEGASLKRSVSVAFDVVAVGPRAASQQGDGAPSVLGDRSPTRTSRLGLQRSDEGVSSTLPLEWGRPLRLSCAEPLDPRTLFAEDFEVVPLLRPPGAPGTRGPAVPVERILLESNEPQGAMGESGARVRIHLRDPLDVLDGADPVAFELVQRGDTKPRAADFSGGLAFQGPIRFFVARQDAWPVETADAYELDFTDDLDFAAVLDPASDGTARWAGNGRVDVRYPAAAGSGADGRIVLHGAEMRRDIHSTGLRILADEEVQLGAKGLVILRAQGRIDIEGALRRSAPEAQQPPPMWDPVLRPLAEQARSVESLSDWLAKAAALDAPWTVVIAGGDLVVTGELDIGTPLLLVAGGRIRGLGRPRATPGQLWLLGDGGGFDLPHTVNPGAHPNVEPPLFIDEPIANPLVEPLTFVAISSPVPKGRRPVAWRAPTVRGGQGASGTFRVQYLDAQVLKGGEAGLGQAVRYASPNGVTELAERGAAVCLRIELSLRPSGGLWDPPFVDRVRLAWNPESR